MFSGKKNENFHLFFFFFFFFFFFAQNIDCENTLEPPPPVLLCYIKVGYKGVNTVRTCNLDVYSRKVTTCLIKAL